MNSHKKNEAGSVKSELTSDQLNAAVKINPSLPSSLKSFDSEVLLNGSNHKF